MKLIELAESDIKIFKSEMKLFMYQKILSEISQNYYVNNYPNEGQRFVAWYLRNIHGLDTVQAKEAITDGAGDKQIDAVYIDDQTSTI